MYPFVMRSRAVIGNIRCHGWWSRLSINKNSDLKNRPFVAKNRSSSTVWQQSTKLLRSFQMIWLD